MLNLYERTALILEICDSTKSLFGKLSELGFVGLEDDRIILEYPNPKILKSNIS